MSSDDEHEKKEEVEEEEAPADEEEDDSEDEEADAEEVLMMLTERPALVEYCPTCTFPAEYCEFSGRLQECKPWLETQAISAADLKERGKAKKKEKVDGEKELPGGKKKKKQAQEVVVSVTNRGGRKRITSVKGMDQFGHRLDEVAKTMKKQLSCGASVATNPGQPDCIEIQGDVLDILLQRLPKKFGIPESSIFKMEDKQKVPAFAPTKKA